MCVAQVILSADPSLGRVDCSLMSDQTLMEMLIDGFDDKTQKKYQEYDETYINVCIWPCITCDEDERVIEINMDSINITGSIQLCYVPPSVKYLKIRNQWRHGKLSGSIDLAQLPEGMQLLDLQHNQLTGELDLARLPDRMRCIYLNYNQFTGEIDLAHLPYRIHYLFLENNQLTGEIDFTRLPGEMRELHLENNQLSGPLVLKGLPREMCCLNARRNNFDSVAVVDSKTRARIMLRGSGVSSVVDENGGEIYMKRFL